MRAFDCAPFWLIAASMAVGLALGILSPDDSDAIDGALIMAGVVHYPAQAAMNAYAFGTWTIIHQIGALMLVGGINQYSVTLFFSIVPRAFIVAALAMTIYGFSRRPIYAFFGALVCYLTGVLAPVFMSPDHGFNAASWLSSTEFFPGVWGGTGAAWVLACMIGGRYTLAGFSAAVLVAIHPVYGVYAVALLLLVPILHFVLWREWGPASRIARGLMWGALPAAASFAAFLITRPAMASGFDPMVYGNYMQYWDFHRHITMTTGAAIRLGAAALAACAALLTLQRLDQDNPRVDRVGLITLLAAVVASTLLYYMAHTLKDFLPDIFTRAMPSKLTNAHAYLAGAAFVGMVCWAFDRFSPGISGNSARTTLAARARASILLLIVVGAGAGFVLWRHPPPVIARIAAEGVGATIDRITHRVATLRAPADSEEYWSDALWINARQAQVDGIVLAVPGALTPALERAHLAATLEAYYVDMLPYVPAAAPAIARVIEQGYGIPFADPPLALRNRGGLENQPADIAAIRAYWSRLGPDEWRAIGRAIGAGAVVAPTAWQLKLPILAQGDTLSLYRIPSND